MKKIIISLVLVFSFSQIQAETMPEIMAAVKHASPLPGLMMVIKKHGDKLNMSEDQKINMTTWSEQHSPVMKKIALDIKSGEQAIYDATLNGTSKSEVMAQLDTLLEKRKEIATIKIDCRDNMRNVLNDEQWKQLIELYKGM